MQMVVRNGGDSLPVMASKIEHAIAEARSPEQIKQVIRDVITREIHGQKKTALAGGKKLVKASRKYSAALA